MEWRRAFGIVDSILEGETVLVEYTTSYIPEFLLKFFVEYSKERSVPLLIDDNFDSLHVVYTHAQFLGIDIDVDDVYVLKTGGKHDVGKVVERVQFHPDPRVYLKNYIEASSKLYEEIQRPLVNLVLGVHDIFLLVREPVDVYRIILNLQRFIGNRKRKAFYVINKNISNSLPGNLLPELERIATTVIDLKHYHTGAELRVKKTVSPKLLGLSGRIEAGGWKE